MSFSLRTAENPDGLTDAQQRGEELARVAELRDAAFVAFDALGYDAGALARRYGAVSLSMDVTFAAVLDEHAEAYRAHLDALTDPEGEVWAAGLHP